MKHVALGVMLALVVGCGRGTEPKSVATETKPVLAFVAASTRDAVQEIAAAFQAERKVEVKINADDSSKLATQIAQDAPAHLFLSANEKWADFVKEKGFTQQITLLLGNSLVIVVPKGTPAKIQRPEHLTSPAVKKLAVAGPTVPAGIYGRQALKKLALWDSLDVNKKIVAGDNVRVVLTYVERGEVEAGIVYATDARITDKVDLVATFPAETHDPIRYPLVLLKTANPSARAFHEFLQSGKAREIFTKHGFVLINNEGWTTGN